MTADCADESHDPNPVKQPEPQYAVSFPQNPKREQQRPQVGSVCGHSGMGISPQLGPQSALVRSGWEDDNTPVGSDRLMSVDVADSVSVDVEVSSDSDEVEVDVSSVDEDDDVVVSSEEKMDSIGSEAFWDDRGGRDNRMLVGIEFAVPGARETGSETDPGSGPPSFAA